MSFDYTDWHSESMLDPHDILVAMLKQPEDEELQSLRQTLEDCIGDKLENVAAFSKPGVGRLVNGEALEEWLEEFAVSCGAVSSDHEWLVVDWSTTAEQFRDYCVEIEHDDNVWLFVAHLSQFGVWA